MHVWVGRETKAKPHSPPHHCHCDTSGCCHVTLAGVAGFAKHQQITHSGTSSQLTHCAPLKRPEQSQYYVSACVFGGVQYAQHRRRRLIGVVRLICGSKYAKYCWPAAGEFAGAIHSFY